MMKVVVLVLIWLFVISSQVVRAQAWHLKTYNHYSKDEPLTDLLKDFSSNVGVPVVLSESLIESAEDATFNGAIKNQPAKAVLDRLSRAYQLAWYYDGHLLYIYKNIEMVTRMLLLKAVSPDTLLVSLKSLGVYDPRYTFRPMGSEKLVMVSGPERYVSMVEEVGHLLDKQEEALDEYVLRVFQLNYAWAADRNYSRRGESRRVPGVATMVRQILSEENIARNLQTPGEVATAAKQQRVSEFNARSKLKGQGLNGAKSAEAKPQSSEPQIPAKIRSAGGAYIQANAAQNAVIVYDSAHRMHLYDELIQALDVPTEQLEIKVSVIDVSTDRFSELGVDWRYADGNGTRLGFGGGNIFTPEDGLSLNFGNNLSSRQLSTSTLGGSKLDYFIGKVRALESDGDSQVLSEPTVLTLNNQEAVIDNSTTFFVRLAGQEEVDLIPVTVGSVLRVTPRIIRESNQDVKISLDLSIEDGQRSDAPEVDEIPSVSTSTITTQAVIEARSSLLVGGYFIDRQDKDKSKIPFLGSIPLIEKLFSNERRNRSKVARLFMISPRIVTEQGYAELYERSDKIATLMDQEKSFKYKKFKTERFEIFD